MKNSPCRLVWVTDPHLPHARRDGTYGKFLDELGSACAGADGLVITGDVATADSLERTLVDVADAAGVRVYFVLGNHDFYGGMVDDVRGRASRLTRQDEDLLYLHTDGLVSLSGGVALVGVDGWGDAQFGNWSGSRVRLNDFRLIRDLAGRSGMDLIERLRELGAESAARLKPTLDAALEGHDRVVVATHVPPFEEAAWHEGGTSEPDYMPYFSCKATGDVIRAAAEQHPNAEITVLCGHTHGEGVVRPAPNLTVRTGGMEYGAPRIHGTLSFD